MIVVKLELWPKGDATKAVSLGQVVITNDVASGKVGNYNVRAWGRKNRPLRRYARVDGFPRTRLSAHHLLKRALVALGY